jgi:hypothetical protein
MCAVEQFADHAQRVVVNDELRMIAIFADGEDEDKVLDLYLGFLLYGPRPHPCILSMSFPILVSGV